MQANSRGRLVKFAAPVAAALIFSIGEANFGTMTLLQMLHNRSVGY